MLTRSISLVRAPAAAPGGMIASSRARSSLVSLMSMALRFSSRCRRVLLLGIGIMSVTLGQQPGQRQLRRGDRFLLGAGFELGEQVQVVLEVARLQARVRAAAVAIGKVLAARGPRRRGSRVLGASRPSSPCRSRGRLAVATLGVPGPEGVFHLQGNNGMDCLRPADRGRAGF